MRMGNFRDGERLSSGMAANQPIGIDHVTVVPGDAGADEEPGRDDADEA